MPLSIAPRVRHRLIVRHPSRAEVLIDSGGLPQLITEEQHTAAVDYLNAAVAERFGVRTTVLRSISHSDVYEGLIDRVHELEALDEGAMSSAGLQWRSIAKARVLDDELDRQAIRLWLVEKGAGVVDGREWTQVGWFAVASAWIGGALERAGLGVPRKIVQLRTWATSTVLIVHTAADEYYFKALPKSGRVEAALTHYLAGHFADAVPRVVAADLERGWLLMAACRGRKLEELTDVTLWERAATRYARLQVACFGRVDELRALGCPARGLDALSRSIAELAVDTAVLRPGHPNGLAEAEFMRFGALVPELTQRCQQLAASGIPDSLEHGDLWPANIICDAQACAVIDWEDALVAHPFFSLAPLTAGLMSTGLGNAESTLRLQQAYAKGFESIASPTQLRRAIELALPLCFFDMAARYRRQHPSIVRQHPWMRDLVPQTIRLALSHLP